MTPSETVSRSQEKEGEVTTNLDDNYLNATWGASEHPLATALMGEIRYLAIETICPITGEPSTQYEVGAVRGLQNFGFNLLCYLESKGLIEVK